MQDISDQEHLAARIRRIRHVALDMDGTIYLGDRLFPETRPFLTALGELGITYSFLTNNSSKSAEDYVAHLGKLGIEAQRSDCFTSAHATIELLRQRSDIGTVYMVGTASLKHELKLSGFRVLDTESSEAPEAVVIGFDTDLHYASLCKATYWIKKGLPYYATHPDYVCPTPLETILIDCGAVCAAIEAATRRKPDAIGGKPEPAMLHVLAHRLNLQNDEIAMVGDRLYTDLRMAQNAGAFGVLTLTGESQLSDLETSEVKVDLVVNHLADFASVLRRFNTH